MSAAKSRRSFPPPLVVAESKDATKKALTAEDVNGTTLTDLCRLVIVSKLERYPPEAFGVCDGDEWQSLIRLRHARTQPKQCPSSHRIAGGSGGGGIDGTGRMVPAVSDKVMMAIEACNPHLADCPVVDTLVWKDCVEYKFRKGSNRKGGSEHGNSGNANSNNGHGESALLVHRPVALFLPWPLLVAELQQNANNLLNPAISTTVKNAAMDALQGSPMNVSLLKDSGVGKLVKKAIKATEVTKPFKERLEVLLKAWMDMAASDGIIAPSLVATPTSPAPAKAATLTRPDDASTNTNSNATRADLELAETCRSWRDLFAALSHRNDEIRSSQGKRMREIRKNLAKTRPKLVKVRPTVSAQQNRVLERAAATASGSGTSRHNNDVMAQLRKETTIRAERQKSSAAAAGIRPKTSSFGDAVAFAAVSKKGMVHKRKQLGGSIQQLSNGKRMKVPTKVVQGSAGNPRQFASKWKTAPPPK